MERKTKNMIWYNRFRSISCYLLIILFLAVSGTPYLDDYGSYLMIVVFIATAVLGLVFAKNGLKKDGVLFVVVYLLIVIISMVLNMDTDIMHLISLMLMYIAALIITQIMEFEEFKEKYLSIMFVLAVSSLIFFTVGLIAPQIPSAIPQWYPSRRVRNAGLYFYTWSNFFGMIDPSRNNGIFREPGMYQVFLNLALLFLNGSSKNSMKYKILFAATILTTFSTTGIFAMICIIASDLFSYSVKMTKKEFMSLVVMILGAIIIVNYIGDNAIQLFSKFDADTTSYVSFSERAEATLLDIKIWLESSIISPVVGVSYEKYSRISMGATNSLTGIVAQHGIVAGVFLLGSLMNLIRRGTKNRLQMLLYFMSIVMIVCTQATLTCYFFTVLCIYGFIDDNKERKKIIWQFH